MASSQQSTFQLSAANISWGRRECYTALVTVAATALDAKYFTIDVPTTSDFGSNGLFYVWFDLDAGSVDPAPAGRTAIEVDVVTGDDEAAVAGKMITAIAANANFRAKLDSADTNNETVIIEAEFKGAVTNDAADVDTTFTITQQRDGEGGDLGKTLGGVEVTMETSSVQILADQTGQLVQDEVLTGQTAEATMSFLEMTPGNWQRIVGTVTGDVHTPSGGTQLVGFGESRLYASLKDLGGELVMHPTRLAASDRSQDITLWKSAPKPSSINFSGEEPQVMEVTFTALLDGDVNTNINLMAFGDNDQDVS